MRQEQKCAAALFKDIKAAFYSVFAEVALGRLLPTGTREQLFDKAGPEYGASDMPSENCWPRADEVIMAQGLEPVWRRAAQDWHIGCSIGVKGKEGRTVRLVGHEAWGHHGRP